MLKFSSAFSLSPWTGRLMLAFSRVDRCSTTRWPSFVMLRSSSMLKHFCERHWEGKVFSKCVKGETWAQWVIHGWWRRESSPVRRRPHPELASIAPRTRPPSRCGEASIAQPHRQGISAWQTWTQCKPKRTATSTTVFRPRQSYSTATVHWTEKWSMSLRTKIADRSFSTLWRLS